MEILIPYNPLCKKPSDYSQKLGFPDSLYIQWRNISKETNTSLSYWIVWIGIIPDYNIQITVLTKSLNSKIAVLMYDFYAYQVYFDGMEVGFANVAAEADIINRRIRISRPAIAIQTDKDWLHTGKRILKYYKHGFKAFDFGDWKVNHIIKLLKAPHSFAVKWNKMRREIICSKQFKDIIWPYFKIYKHTTPIDIKGIFIDLTTETSNGIYKYMKYLTYDNPPSPIVPNTSAKISDKIFDFTEGEDINAKTYLSESNDNIVIYSLPNKSGVCQGVAYKKSLLQEHLQSTTHLQFPCNNTAIIVDPFPEPAININMEKPLVKIFLPNFTVFVPISDILATINCIAQRFKIFKTDESFETTASAGASFGTDNDATPMFMSADHCQRGSNKTVYRLLSTEVEGYYHSYYGGKPITASKQKHKQAFLYA
jgi:hypothetical protein